MLVVLEQALRLHQDGQHTIRVVVDDDGPGLGGSVNECNDDNNAVDVQVTSSCG